MSRDGHVLSKGFLAAFRLHSARSRRHTPPWVPVNQSAKAVPCGWVVSWPDGGLSRGQLKISPHAGGKKVFTTMGSGIKISHCRSCNLNAYTFKVSKNIVLNYVETIRGFQRSKGPLDLTLGGSHKPCVCVCACALSCVRLLAVPWAVGYQAPPCRGSPGKHAGGGCHFLLQGAFLAQGLNPVSSVPCTGGRVLCHRAWVGVDGPGWEACSLRRKGRGAKQRSPFCTSCGDSGWSPGQGCWGACEEKPAF